MLGSSQSHRSSGGPIGFTWGKPWTSGWPVVRSLSKVEEGGHGHEKATKRPTAVQAMRPAPERQEAALPRELTRDKL